MIKLIESIVSGFEYEIKSSNVSSNGKYFSLNLNVLVNSEFMRDEIFAGLKSDEFILMVL